MLTACPAVDPRRRGSDHDDARRQDDLDGRRLIVLDGQTGSYSVDEGAAPSRGSAATTA
ncbi:MAG: hypothetical protein K0V04_10275 [Deltaproteobacteria bacterium]|nr:hypothetical protein [Deltaproteobacteria bacterium]